MIASRAKRHSRTGLACGLGHAGLIAAALLANPAAAQDGRPMSLFPPSVSAPVVEAPAGDGPAVDGQAPALDRPRARIKTGGIEINPLRRSGVEGVGVLDPGSGGFGLGLWQDSERPAIDQLITRIPADLSSPALRDLARRLLLSSAPPPQGAEGAEGFLTLRARSLRNLGEAEALAKLMRLVPQTTGAEPAVARLRVEADLLRHARDEACQQVQNVVSRHTAEVYWQQALIYCQLSGGERAAAQIGLDLLRESGDADPEFLALANAVAGIGEAPETVAPTPLKLALLTLREAPLPPALLESGNPGLLAWLATGQTLDLPTRRDAAERAAAAGALPADVLQQLYAVPSFEAAQLDAALTRAPDLPGAEGRALLYQAAAAQPLPPVRAELLAALLADTPAERELGVSAAVLPLVAELPAQADLGWFAPAAARALLLGGRYDAAGAWLDLVRWGVSRGQVSAEEAAALRPLLAVTGRTGLRLPVEETPQTQGDLLAAALLNGLGEQVPVAWNEALAEAPAPVGAMPPAAAAYALRQAAAAGRAGETGLLVLLLLGESGTAGSHLLMVDESLRALTAVGLGNEARALAIETVARRGL